MSAEYESVEDPVEDDLSDSEPVAHPDRKQYDHVTLAEVRVAFESGRTSDACEMLDVAPHLAIDAVAKVHRLSDGQGLLHQISSDGHHDQLATLLGLVRALQRDADNPSLDADVLDAINKQDARGRTALHCAAAGAQRSDKGSVLCGSLLIDAGAKAVDWKGLYMNDGN